MLVSPNNKKNIFNTIIETLKKKEINIMSNLSPFVEKNNQNTIK